MGRFDEYNTKYLNNVMDLRLPQYESLKILDKLCKELSLNKAPNLNGELDKVNKLYPICVDFEREFPSLCFALATGVGKTKLMGAFIAYLYTVKGIRNFFVVAPNLTVYEKLKKDFGDPTNSKYVFKGVGAFSTANRPHIITGDDYHQQNASQLSMFNQSGQATIYIFNISKFNREVVDKKGGTPNIKKLSEYMGQSYFEYYASLSDLAVLMDESHHYRAEQGLKALNELKPILGLELTATPINRDGSKFKNVVYEYSLHNAIRDGFVKLPAVAAKENLSEDQFTPIELDQRKIKDGLYIHELTKTKIDIYARNNSKPFVKPFVLIVGESINHANEIKEFVESSDCYNGRYKGKVLIIHNKQGSIEKDENIELLLGVERVNNPIEIVIHVNMLKEGWDVNNLYTIIPLRRANSKILREQTIGRGLRLPYGKRTGDADVDRLTVVAHDKFQEIIDDANKEDSIFKREHIISIDDFDYRVGFEVVTSTDSSTSELLDQKKGLKVQLDILRKQEDLTNEQKSLKADSIEAELKKTENTIDAHNTVKEVLFDMGKQGKTMAYVNSEQGKRELLELARKKEIAKPQQSMFLQEKLQLIEKVIQTKYDNITANIIEIPRIILQTAPQTAIIHDFDLDVGNVNWQPEGHRLIFQELQSGKRSFITPEGETIQYDSLPNTIVNELVNYCEIDYFTQSQKLYKWTGQLIQKLQSYLNEKEIADVVVYNKKHIAHFIYTQIMNHFELIDSQYMPARVYPFTSIHEHSFSKADKDREYHFTETIEPRSEIPNKVFVGFKKTYLAKSKFHSKTEKDFAIILEQDEKVQKWLRPAKTQFDIWWNNNTQKYEPDFVVETAEAIYLVETKKLSDIDTQSVQKKAKAALKYCENATKYTAKLGGKPWKYVLIPHDAVLFNVSYDSLVKKFEYKYIMKR